MSCYSYLNQQRIMYAEKLLIDPSLSITDVAMQSGFVSLATFNRVFKTYKNCTPTQYKLLQGVHILSEA
ncbi:Virulence regulon transcriptional activator VirF [compost metagenome]